MRRSLPLLVLLLSSVAQAATHHVPGQYATIQEAIDAAVVGDSVLVAPGTYTGQDRTGWVCANWLTQNVVADLKPGLVLIGTGGPEVTILNGVTTSTYGIRTLRLVTQDGPPTSVEGFTITGERIGVSIGCTDSEVTLRDCWIVDNPNAGIMVSGASVELDRCYIGRNGGQAFVGAAHVSFDGRLRVSGSRFEENTWGG